MICYSRHPLLQYVAIVVFATFAVVGYGLHGLPGLEHGCWGNCCHLVGDLGLASEGCDLQPSADEVFRTNRQSLVARCELCELLVSLRMSKLEQFKSYGHRLEYSYVFPGSEKSIVVQSISKLPPSRGPPASLS